jgi:hypothetical protein
MTLSFPSATARLLSSPELDKKLCESFGCDNEATVETGVSAGKYGIIILNLCTDCAVKFQ